MNWTSKQIGFKRPTKSGPQIISDAHLARGGSVRMHANTDCSKTPPEVTFNFSGGWRWSVEDFKEIAAQAERMRAEILDHLEKRASVKVNQIALFSEPA